MALDAPTLVDTDKAYLEASRDWPSTERVHEAILDRELRKAHRAATEEMIRNGRWMFAWGVVTGIIVGMWLL